METEYLDLINIGRLIAPMSDLEFWEFLGKDKYGLDNFDKESALILLNKIMSLPGYEAKEIMIYKKLKEYETLHC